MLIGVIGFLVFAAVVSLVLGLARRASSVMEARMQDFRTRAVAPVEGEADLSEPFAERVLVPGIEGLANVATSVLPARVLANIEKQLVMAGNPMTLNAYVVFWMLSVSLMAGLVLVSVLVVWGTVGIEQAVAVLVFGVVGWMLPGTWLKGRVRRRQKEVLKALPDGLDLVTTCVGAGLGLDAALARVAEKSSGPLADELARMLREVAMGKLRREAMTEMSNRIGVEELTSFVNGVIQAEQLGVGIAQVLRVQADQMRTRRRQRVEQAAHEAPIKMIFPLVLFIFPAFMLVILGPAVIRIATSLAGT
ncbi:MAG: type II secretion system F family protein [Dehalococcoidia bacterium]|nr:MAG: type II secretion system F family protein [Dehalococcoidia bacterium]